jgi:hypothetical protein
MVFVAADSTAGNVGMKGSAFRSTVTKEQKEIISWNLLV